MRLVLGIILACLNAPSLAAEWQPLAPMPTARSEMSAAVWQQTIYVPGGLGGTRQFKAYDTVMQQWRQLPLLPEGRHHLAIAAYKGKIFLFGGADESWRATDTTLVYDIEAGDWRRAAPMPAARYAAAAVVIEPYIYVVGGDGPGGETLRYDPARDRWHELAVNLQRREHTTAVAYDGKIMIVGGRWHGIGELDSSELFDPEHNLWALGPTLNTARGGFTAVKHKNRIYAFGGEVMMNGNATLLSVERLGPDGWSLVDPMPLALHGVPAVSHGDFIYLLGGSQRAGAIVNNGASFRSKQY